MLLRKRLAVAGLGLCFVGVALAEDWPAWRGPRGDGTSRETKPPVHWGSTEGVVWKAVVPGEGHSSPIVWRDRVFLSSASAESEERLLICFDRRTGSVLWQEAVLRAPLEAKNRENSYASATPVTDGEAVYVTFLDREEVVVAAYNFSGRQLWSTRPGRFKSQWGFSHTPVLFEDKVLLACYSKGENFVVGLSRTDGRLQWKTGAQHPSQSYSPPLVRELAGRPQMIVPGNEAITSYDPGNGRVLWSVEGLANDSVITPVFHEQSGLLLSGTSWPKKVLYAVQPDGNGDVTSSKIVWTTTEGAPYVPSPLAVGDWFFTSSFVGTAAYCFEAATGTVLWKEPMGLHHASPVSAGGLVYFLNDEGVMHVVKAQPVFELVARNELGEKTYASPALSDGQIFLRGFEHLYCIGVPHTPSGG